MREGEVARPQPGEKVTCIRSGLGGGPFIFDVELAPGTGGPPTHTHDEGDEIVEVLEGEVVFRVNGEEKLLRAGDSLTLTPKDAHTFWNPSKTDRVVARVTHGPRFERLIVQPGLTALTRRKRSARSKRRATRCIESPSNGSPTRRRRLRRAASRAHGRVRSCEPATATGVPSGSWRSIAAEHLIGDGPDDIVARHGRTGVKVARSASEPGSRTSDSATVWFRRPERHSAW